MDRLRHGHPKYGCVPLVQVRKDCNGRSPHAHQWLLRLVQRRDETPQVLSCELEMGDCKLFNAIGDCMLSLLPFIKLTSFIILL